MKSLLDRRRYLPDINSANQTVRAQAERIAINAPMQGTAADIIKIAMVRIHNELEEKGLASKLLLQVHDELVLDVPQAELARVEDQLPRLMAGVATLKVPLVAEVGAGANWEEAH